MGHQIIEAIIEDGHIRSVNKKLPNGKIKVHLIYDTEEIHEKIDMSKIIAETSGIYKNMDAETESKKLRLDWERNVND